MAKNRYDDLTDNVMELVGGKENIEFFTHCVTRLRFNMKDKSAVNVPEIKKIPGVIGCQWSGDQLQIIIGQSVGDAYDLICKKCGFEKEESIVENLDAEKKKFSFSLNGILSAISGCLVPLIPVLVAGGLLKVLVLIGTQLGILTAKMPTYTVLTFVGDAAFYFLPVFVGATTAKKFGGNQGLGMLVGAMLIHPTFIAQVAENSGGSIFGIPIYAATYATTIFPSIISVWVMCYIERFIAKHSPETIRSVIVPLVTMLFMIPLTLCALAPIGGIVGNYLIAAIVWIHDKVGFLAVALLATFMSYFIATGMHMAMTPYVMSSFASLGYEPFMGAANLVSNINQGVVCLVVALKTKEPNLKSTALSCAISAVVGGIVEPALFGITLRYKKAMYAAMIGSFAGGLYAGLMNVHVFAFATGGMFGLPAYIGPTSANLINMCLALVIGAVVTFIAGFILYKEEN